MKLINDYSDIIYKAYANDRYISLIQDKVLQNADLQEDFQLFSKLLKDKIILKVSDIIEKATDLASHKILDEHANPVNIPIPAYNLFKQEQVSQNLYYISKVDDYIQQKAVDIVTQGIQQGLSTVDIAKQLTAKIPQIAKNRAKVIARSQLIQLSANAQEIAMKSNGFDEYTWVTAHDNRVCPICKALDGKTFKFSDPNHPLPVKDTHPNCRCVIVKAR